MRVAFVPRSAEIKPLFFRFVTKFSPPRFLLVRSTLNKLTTYAHRIVVRKSTQVPIPATSRVGKE
jgi:hypothetical protein